MTPCGEAADCNQLNNPQLPLFFQESRSHNSVHFKNAESTNYKPELCYFGNTAEKR